jgi:hypothetical protein
MAEVGAGGAVVFALSKEGSASFLKKRLPAWGSKKLLLLGAVATARPRPAVSKSFFASFFSKKEVLT